MLYFFYLIRFKLLFWVCRLTSFSWYHIERHTKKPFDATNQKWRYYLQVIKFNLIYLIIGQQDEMQLILWPRIQTCLSTIINAKIIHNTITRTTWNKLRYCHVNTLPGLKQKHYVISCFFFLFIYWILTWLQ